MVAAVPLNRQRAMSGNGVGAEGRLQSKRAIYHQTLLRTVPQASDIGSGSSNLTPTVDPPGVFSTGSARVAAQNCYENLVLTSTPPLCMGNPRALEAYRRPDLSPNW